MEEKNQIVVVVTHNSVHVVKKVFVGCNIVCVVGADHVLYDVSDERHLWCNHVEKKDIKNENKKRLHRLAKSVREKTRSSEEKEDEGGRHKSPVLVVIMMIITAIVDLDDLDYVDDNAE